ncbi:MAG: transcription-repair coupling factor [Erysipelotrichaceae bacterium]|nr:transcription-repair coupling factor [Erysipelotrichaceae bacterium]
MDELFRLMADDPAVQAFNRHQPGLNCLSDVEETLIIAESFRQHPRKIVAVKENVYTAQQLYNRLYPLLKDDVLLFSVEESLRVEAVAASPSNYANQMNVLTTLCLEERPMVIVTHGMALIRYLPSRQTFRNHVLDLRRGQLFGMEQLKEKLIASGYRQTARVDQPLTFSQRGGVIDVFSIQNDRPVRIEFFDEEIDSIRYFDISSQRTVEKAEEVRIVPASALIYDEDFSDLKEKITAQLERDREKASDSGLLSEAVARDLDYLENHISERYLYRYQAFFRNCATLLDYIDDPDVIINPEEAVESSLEMNIRENDEYLTELFLDNRGLNYHSVFADFEREVSRFRPYRISGVFESGNAIKSDIRLSYFPLLPLDKAVDEIIRLSENYHIHVSLNEGQLELLENHFSVRKLKMSDYLKVCPEELTEGFIYHEEMYLSGKELFGIKQIRGRFDSKFREAEVLDSYQDLKKGDYVVHSKYGVGLYEGIITREINGHHQDYLQIRYRDNDALLVPLEQFKLVRKFLAAEGVGIRLNKLGSNRWNRTKEKISQEVNDIAERLMDLYSAREQNIGFAFSKDDDYSRQFERNFPYVLTDDQIKAIAEVKYDMEQPKPMDRLLCGDVGFGKTEVAMIAAFKACKDLKQVAYLCPTTILSRQHYNTFKERFKDFPFSVELINRYVPDYEQKDILKRLKEGKIDILIGTHRLLSRDVQFADLGLLIIDEEQRFGVQAKEKIKELKKTIDVLSLSATPIPRTMQMSLVGVMSLSQLNTPPQNRMAIQTYVVEKNDSLIRETIQRELARGGQVFYLHNNVSDIYDVARKIKTLVPQADIAIGHGQMNREEIEDVMYRFVEGRYNVLVCTTIIETGIDIPNANTVLIENAEHFGLAQLYQIRGRVGRSDRIAYAYLMYDNNRQLSETASKRLQAIKEFTELGSGYKVALRDLTIRGAGDLLGERQAGFINTIGMSLYLEMLNDAIRRRKGLAEEIVEEPQFRTHDVDGYIPDQFVSRDYEKLSIYQQLAAITTQEELEEFHRQQQDYYGKLPVSINNLFVKKRIELLLNNHKIEDYYELAKENGIVLTPETSGKVDGIQFFGRMYEISPDIRLKYLKGKITITIPKNRNYHARMEEILKEVDKL